MANSWSQSTTGLAAGKQASPGLVMATLGALVLIATLLLSYSLVDAPGELLTRNTVRLALAWYFLALLVILTQQDWTEAGTDLVQLARWCWTWGLVCFLVHLGVAFHYYHHWSHAHAVEHTRQVSGFGGGVYISYAFTVLWLADVVWWWVAPAGYAARSAWVGRALHTFMLFMVFNGTVVFESGPIRWVGLIALASLALVAAARLSRCGGS